MAIATDVTTRCGHCGNPLTVSADFGTCEACYIAGHTTDLMDCPRCAGTNAPAIVQGSRSTEGCPICGRFVPASGRCTHTFWDDYHGAWTHV